MSQHNPHRHRHSALTQPSRQLLVDSAVRSGLASQSGVQAVTHGEVGLSLSSQEQQRFHALYCEHFDFVFRNLRRLGVPAASTDDALQEVYLVVLRRLRDLEHNAHVKAWLFAIILRVASNQRRTSRRRGTPEPLGEHSLASAQPDPFELAARAEAAQFLHNFLSSLDDNRRAVFIMAELEQLTAPETAQVLGANLNTVYSWLRSARIAFSQALERMQTAGGAAHE